ncbi:MAG: cytochrome c biogenesis protein CcsA [Bdellovibrionales bacterium]|nr:cytochrome c biogenesis protein CcsA [Bdellovibrionales bacterium]
MYETVIWVPWVSVILGALLWWRQKMFAIFACACSVALFCLLLADSAPALLDGRLEPLEAVLRSNFWLTTHVLIITMSYSAFFLAFAIGDVLLFMFLYPKGLNKIKSYARCIDRSIQVGVVLLAAGTILGGIWADYSWGRFWGWDPKETWALISLLGYLALLHARLVGWVKEFGLAVGSVLIFFLIVMAWYGVNYVLGQGLHSYGFGSGGVEYVAGFALLHLIYVLSVYFLRNRNNYTHSVISKSNK